MSGISPRNGSSLSILGLAAACFFITAQIHGSDIIYGNYDPITFDGISNGSPGGPQWLGAAMANREAVAFTTDANTYNLDSVQLVMSRLLGNASDLTLSLCSDAGGMPDSSLDTFSNPAVISQGSAIFTTTGFTLAPDTTYWIVAEPNDSGMSEFDWWNSLAPGYSGSSQFDSNSNAWGQWSAVPADNSPSLVVYGTPVPEPSALALFGFGAIAFGFLLRRRFKPVDSLAPAAIQRAQKRSLASTRSGQVR